MEEEERRREAEEKEKRRREEEDRWLEAELARGRDAVARATSIMEEQIATADAIVSRPRKRKEPEPVEDEEGDDDEEEEEEEVEEAGPSALPMVCFFFLAYPFFYLQDF